MLSFCKPVSSKKRFLPFRKLNDTFSFTLFDRIEAVPASEWDSVTTGSTTFLERSFLKIVERGEHTRLACRYVIVYQDKKPCGIIYFQVVDFKAEVFGSLMSQQVEVIKSKRLNLFERYIDSNKDEVLLRLFTCGNNLVSGEYGFLFVPQLNPEIAADLLLEITDLISKEEKLRGTISAILLKDFPEPLQPASLFSSEKYSEFQVEPNMIVEIPQQIGSLAAYVELFSKKYRNRAKSIFKKLEPVQVRELNLTAIRGQENEIYHLYEAIFENAKFKLIKLPHDYFSSVKHAFPDTFKLKGFYLENRLVAFASFFLMSDGSLEAHYIGFDYSINNEYCLYQNILYLMLREAIDHKRYRVNLGRTAAEIKTTVGAKPQNLICYIKPQNTISRIIQKPFISFLQPAQWTPRNPFKEETEKGEDKNVLVT